MDFFGGGGLQFHQYPLSAFRSFVVVYSTAPSHRCPLSVSGLISCRHTCLDSRGHYLPCLLIITFLCEEQCLNRLDQSA